MENISIKILEVDCNNEDLFNFKTLMDSDFS